MSNMVKVDGLLNAEAIFNSAAKKSGLENYADEGMRERFSRLIDNFNQNGAIEDWALPAALNQIQAVIERRLEVARDFELYPEIENERIERPFFVVGQARTGTTALQSLLALGDGCRTPLSWECRHPSPPPGLDPDSEPDRIAAENLHQQDIINTAPGLLLSHPYVDKGAYMVTDDEDLIALDFHTAYAWQYHKVPVLPILHNVKISTMTEALRFHKRMLKYLQWKRPTQRWVGKGQFFQQIPSLWEVYPDSVCVIAHRDPVVFIASTLGILSHYYGPVTGLVVRGEFAHQLVEGVQAIFDKVLGSGWLNDERIIHLRFDDFIKDQIGSIRRIHEHGGLICSEESITRQKKWLADPANKSDRHGKFVTTLEQFGLDKNDVRRRFADYYERFLD